MTDNGRNDEEVKLRIDMLREKLSMIPSTAGQSNDDLTPAIISFMLRMFCCTQAAETCLFLEKHTQRRIQKGSRCGSKDGWITE